MKFFDLEMSSLLAKGGRQAHHAQPVNNKCTNAHYHGGQTLEECLQTNFGSTLECESTHYEYLGGGQTRCTTTAP